MAMRTFTRLYDDQDDAAHVAQALETVGIPRDNISVVARQVEKTADDSPASSDAGDGAESGAGTGATLGTVLGGGAGLLAGLGALAIPGVGPIVAAGWLVATLTGAGAGAAAGGLLGSLTGAGVEEADAQVYAEGVRRGGHLVTVQADETQSTAIEAILDGRTPVDPKARRSEYQAEDWQGFDEAAPAYTSEQLTTERRRRVRVS